MRLDQIDGIRALQVVQGQYDGQLEAVICCLVSRDKDVLVGGEVVEVDLICGARDEITELAQFGLVRDVVEKMNQVNVGGVISEMPFESDIDQGFDQETVIDRDQTRLQIPAGLSATGQ